MPSTVTPATIQENKKDFAYYVPRVKEATRLYDEAIEGDNVDWGGKELAMVNMTALEKCQTICRELLADPSLPHEHRILLNYYMSAQRDGDLCRFYLKRALSTVEILEAVEGTVDPMREILETQLKEIVENSNAPLAHLQHDCGTQLLEGLSQSSSIATENERPATATTPKGSSPARRPKFFLKIEQARERGETEAERDTDRDMDIDQ